EWVAGRLLYMPPCEERQSWTVADLVFTLGHWVRSHPGFVFGTNEPGILLRDDVRAADAAIWRRAEARPASPGVSRVPPLLAAEVGGRDEGARELREKARWYLDVGVGVVWILLPKEREVLVVTAAAESRPQMGERLPPDPRLPGLAPQVDELFSQISARCPLRRGRGRVASRACEPQRQGGQHHHGRHQHAPQEHLRHQVAAALDRESSAAVVRVRTRRLRLDRRAAHREHDVAHAAELVARR